MYRKSLRLLRYNLLMDKVIGLDSDNPTLTKENGKSHMAKASLLCRLGEHDRAFSKYYQAYLCFVCCISYHSDAVLGSRKKLHKEVELLLVCLASMAQLYFFREQVREGREVLQLAFFISSMYLKPKAELASYISEFYIHSEQLVV